MAAQSQPTVRIGIVGTGFGGRVQLPGFVKLPGVEVVAVMSSGRRASAEKVAADFKIAQVCDNFDQMLQISDLDAVSIVTPPYQHSELTLQAFAAGKHVLCEKPMAADLQEARAMLDACRKSGLVGMIDHEFRYVPARAYVKELVDKGWLGDLISANISMLMGSSADPKVRPWGWLFDREAGGGFLGALGSHYIDALHYWFGDIAAVTAELDTWVKERYLPNSDQMRPVTADDTFTLFCRFARSGRGMINVSVVTRFGSGERMELYGSQGTLILDNEGRLYGAKAGEERLQQLPIPKEYSDGVSSDDQRLRPFVRLAGDFVNAVRESKVAGRPLGQEVPPSFADGFKVQQVIDAARRSTEAKSWVSLPPPKEK